MRPDMNDMFSFDTLTLGHVEAAKAATILPPGKYVCTSSDAKVQPTKAADGGMVLNVRFSDTKGKGLVGHFFNMHLPGKAEATRIGLEQLKSFLECGGHPDPDNVGEHGIHALNGLTVGVVVKSDTYNGETRSKISGFLKPSEVPGYEGDGSLDSDVPFANPFRGRASYVV
jgi:hypothetical protein